MPEGELATVPDPVPDLITVNEIESSVNVAVTECAAVMSTVHVLVPLQPASPPHPEKTEPVVGVAVNVTEVPEL